MVIWTRHQKGTVVQSILHWLNARALYIVAAARGRYPSRYKNVVIAATGHCENVVVAIRGCCGHALGIVKVLSLQLGVLVKPNACVLQNFCCGQCGC